MATSISSPSRARARLTATALFVGWAVVVLLLVYFLELRPRLRTEAPSVVTVPTAQADFPAPPVGALTYARELGDDALAVAVVPGGDRWILQASVVGPQGEGVSGLRVRFGVEGTSVTAHPCGDGCYRAEAQVDGSPRALVVGVDGDQSTSWRVPLPGSPRGAATLVGSAGRAWRTLRSLSFEERLASGPSRVVASSWRVQAPNRLAYRISGGSSAVVVGNRRWDREPGGRWRTSSQPPLRQPTPSWVAVTNAYVVGERLVGGRPAAVVTFFDPRIPAWFRLVIDRRTFRTLDMRMIATAHFMHDRFHSFDETPSIVPPLGVP